MSQSDGDRIRKALEEGDARGMLGMTTSNSLTQCRHSPAVLEGLTSTDMTCAELRVELIIPTTTQHHLDYMFPGYTMTSIIDNLIQDLSEDERIMEALLLEEQQ